MTAHCFPPADIYNLMTERLNIFHLGLQNVLKERKLLRAN
jgi:hypothetical protein